MGHPVSPSMVTGLVLSYCSWKFPRPVISLKVLHKAHRDIIFTIIMTSKSYCENNISYHRDIISYHSHSNIIFTI